MWWPALGLPLTLLAGVAWETPAGAVLAAAATAGLAWWAVRRRQSGTVRSSEAGELWTAYDKVMERVERDNAQLREDNGKLRERVAVLEREVDRLLPLEREVERLRGIVNGHD